MLLLSTNLRPAYRPAHRTIASVLFALVGCILWTYSALAQSLRVTLLGTGAPPPSIDRFGPSTLVEAGGYALVFDAGRGAIQRLAQTGVPLRTVRKLFLTHLHSDHVVGLPDLWLTGWVAGRPETPLEIWGPVGTRSMMEHLQRAFEFDVSIRLSDDRAPPQGVAVTVRETSGGVVFDEGGVRVTALEVDHRPIVPAFGYKVEFGGYSVVISGDTRASEELIRQGTGADVVIHEVVAPETLRRAGYAADRAQRIINHHVTPQQAGEVFARMSPRLAVYSHIVLPVATEADLVQPTRINYKGRLEVGQDLMVIEVGDSIIVRRPRQ